MNVIPLWLCEIHQEEFLFRLVNTDYPLVTNVNFLLQATCHSSFDDKLNYHYGHHPCTYLKRITTPGIWIKQDDIKVRIFKDWH